MDLVIDIAVLLAGFILLIKGAGWLVDGASALAGKFHVKELVIGLTIVAFGTSAPELVVSVLASADGHQDVDSYNHWTYRSCSRRKTGSFKCDKPCSLLRYE